MKRQYSEAELSELVRTVRVARAAPRGPLAARIWFVLTIIGPVVVLGFIVAMMVRSPRAMVDLWPIMVGAVLLFVVSYFACVITRRRFKRDVMNRDGKVCPNCHYDLSEVEVVDAEAYCPECREPYRMSDLKRVWSGWAPGIVWWD